MGNRQVGKSSTKNTILGREEIDFLTHRCVKRHGEVADRHITVIEAPGWWRNESVEDSPTLLKQEILLSVSLCPPGPHAVLLIIRLDYTFADNNRKVLQGYVDLLGERVWSHAIVLFTHGDSLSDRSIEQYIESEGQNLQWLLDKCGNRYHVLNNKNRSDDTQIKELLEKIEKTVAQNNGCHFEIDRNNSEVINQRKGSSRSFENATDTMGDGESTSSPLTKQKKRSQSKLVSESVRKFHSIGVPPSMCFEGKTVTEIFNRRHTTDPTTSPNRKVGPSMSNLVKISQVNSARLQADSRFGSSCSIVSTGSSGYGSSCSLSQSVEQSEPTYKKRTNSVLKISELSVQQDECEDMDL
ncbi:GTPase IMAP family member 7-like isoform X2 [Carassius auratus]|nr:GTPase IMAP family member 7-like isoform X2 [Carassius auratus]